MSGSKSPAFQFYAAEWLADENVTFMSLEEEGAYIRAIAYCWREGSIPANDELLSKLLKGASNQTRTVVRKCFNQSPTDPSRLVHLRLEREREKQAQWRAKSSKAGMASGKSRREKSLRNEPTFINGSLLVEPKSNSSSSSSFASSFSKEGERPHSEIPPGLGSLRYASGLLEACNIPHDQGTLRAAAAAIDAWSKERGMSANLTTAELINTVRAAMAAGVTVNRFWFTDAKYRQPKVYNPASVGMHKEASPSDEAAEVESIRKRIAAGEEVTAIERDWVERYDRDQAYRRALFGNLEKAKGEKN